MTEALESVRFSALRRFVCAGLLLCFGIAALLSGSDRQSRDFPSSPSYVGWPYDTGAARAKAMLAFVRSGPASAIGYAKRAILSDPISAQTVSVLGRSQLYAEQLPEARRTFQVSGQLGWRDAMTQIYWLDQALQTSDYRVAAERLDALLRQSPDDENRDRFLAAVAAAPEGRAALAERLKLSPSWARTMVTEVRDLPQDQIMQRVDVMRRTGQGVWDCSGSENIAQKLIGLNLLEDAQAVWQQNCETSGTLVYDGGFDKFDILKPTAGFDWQVSNRGDAAIAITADSSGNRRLALEVNAATTLLILRQLVVLKPGRYQLTWRTPDVAPRQASALTVSLTCKADLASAVAGIAVPGRADSWTADFTVDSQCPARQLVFWLSPNAAVNLDDVSLSPIGGDGTD